MTVSVTAFQQVRIFLSDALHSDLELWDSVAGVIPVVLTKKLFPEIDVAKFVYHTGVFPVHFDGVPPGTYGPLDAMRRFIRVQIWQIYDSETLLELPESYQEMLDDWIGIIDRTDLERIYGGTASAGDFAFTAFGLASELEHWTVTTTHIAKSQSGTDPDEYFEINRAIGFNEDYRNAKPGNMHSAASFSGVKLFSKVPNREITDDSSGELAAQWSVKEAVEYTLKRDLDAYTSGTTIAANRIQWDFEIQTADLLDALPSPKIARDRKSVHQILSELVPKKSGIGCRVKFDDAGADTTKLRVYLDYFSTAKDAFTIGSFTFPAAPDQTTLDLRFSQLIDDSFSISESAYESWDQVIVEGAYITATMTIPLYESAFVKAWSDDKESEYVSPNVYSATTEEDKNRLADQIRNSKEFSEVFRTWVIKDPSWSTPLITGTDFYFAPDLSLIDLTSIPEGGTTGILEAFQQASDDYRIDLHRKEFLPHIPIPHSPMENRSKVPFAFVVTLRNPEDTESPIDWETSLYTDVARLDKEGGWYTGRSWSVQMSVGRGETRNSSTFVGPAVHLDVAGGPQHYLAIEEMAAAEYVSPYNDPSTDRVAALDWKHAFVTVAIETDLRFRAEYPETLTLSTDAPPKIKRIVLDQCRLDFALPGWVKSIDANGLLDYSTTGELLRDDRRLIQVACETIWQMSWISRRPFSVTFAELNPQSQNVGVFVTTVESGAGTDTTNTIITQIEYDFKTLKTKFVTQYEETDVVEGLIGVSLQGQGGRV